MAGAGGGGLGFGSGLAQGIAAALLSHRATLREDTQREEARKQRREELLLPVSLRFGEEYGDWTLANEWITRNDPELAKRFKREGSPFDVLGPMMTRSVPGKPTMVTEPIPEVAGATRQVPSGQTTLPSTQGTIATQPVSERTHFLGKRMLTPEERLMQGSDENIKQQLALRMSRQLNIPIAAALDRMGLRETPTARTSTPDPGSFASVVLQKNAERGAQGLPPMNSTEVESFMAEWEKRKTEATQRPTAATEADPFDQYLSTYAKERNKSTDPKAPNALSAQERLDARSKFAKAGSTAQPQTGDSDPQALARLAARNPAVLQGLTPTVVGAAMSALASNPQLQRQYEQTRMVPIRESAQTMIDALQKLIIIDPQTGLPVRDAAGTPMLTPGGKAIFGEYTPVGARSYIPGAAATDANAALAQLSGEQIVDLIAEMKRQSQTGATGFGQLSAPELNILQAASTQLTQRLSEEAAAVQLAKLYDRYSQIMLPSGVETGQPQINLATGAAGAVTGPITLDTPIYIGPDGRPSLTPPAGGR